MSIRLDRQERNYDELHDRIDNSLINSENFRKEMTFEFGEMRGELTEMRGEFTEIRGELTEMRGEFTEIRGELASIRASIDSLTQAINNNFNIVERRLQRLENHAGFNAVE